MFASRKHKMPPWLFISTFLQILPSLCCKVKKIPNIQKKIESGYSDFWEQMKPLFVLVVDVIGDIGHVFVIWNADNTDHGNKTLDSYGTVHDIMTKCPVPRVNIRGITMTKYIWMF